MPILNIVVIVLVLFIAYMWSQQGLFSAFLHFVCTVVAGAIAFAFWEPIAYLLLSHVRDDIAWGIGLAAPFLVSLGLLRVLLDKLVEANMQFPPLANMIGGGAFGLLAGVVSVGVLVISLGFLRLPGDFLGYKPIDYDSRGSLVRGAGLWLPVDRLTAGLYEHMSVGGLGVATPLALAQPNVHEQAAAMRLTFENKGRTTLKPDDFTVVGRYTVKSANPRELLSDSFTIDTSSGRPSEPQAVKDLAGREVGAGASIEGFVINFGPGAKEKGGQVVMGQGQIRLIAEDGDGGAFAVHPFAVVGQADGASVVMSRFRYEAKDIYIGTPSGPSNALLAFEFLVPPGATPTALLVKNVRVPLDEMRFITAPEGDAKSLTVEQRDRAIRARALVTPTDSGTASADGGGGGSSDEGAGAGGGGLDTSSSIVLRGDDPLALQEVGVRLSTNIRNAFSKSNRAGLELDEDNRIVSGEATLATAAFSGTVPASLRVSALASGGDEIVQLDMSFSSRISYLGKTLDLAESVTPPLLIDVNGQQYQAVGFIHESPQGMTIRYTPGDPLRGYGQVPMPSRSKPNDKITLLFRVSKGVDIMSFNLGNKVIVRFDPTLRIAR